MTITECTFRVIFSVEDDGWVATCDQMPSLSWICHDPADAITEVTAMVREAIENPTP